MEGLVPSGGNDRLRTWYHHRAGDDHGMPVALIILACLDLILGALLIVTVQQIKQMGDELQEFKAAQTKRDINIGKLYMDLYGDIELCKRDNATTYELAAECRNELTRQHMNGRNDAWKEKLKPSRQPSEESKG